VARMFSRSGQTAATVEADRLAYLPASPFRWTLLGLAASAALLGGSLPAPAHRILSPVVLLGALAGSAWLLAAPAGALRLLAGSPRALHRACAAMDITVSTSFGILAGWLARQIPARALTLAGAPQEAVSQLPHVHWPPAWAAIPAALAALAALATLRVRGGSVLLRRFRSGLAGELAVERALASLPDTYAVVSNVLLQSPHGGRVEADHVVLGPTGIAVIETKRWHGTVTPGAETWTITRGQRSDERPNPLPKLIDTCRAVEIALGAPTGSAAPILALLGATLASAPGDASVTIARSPEEIARTVLGLGSSWTLPQTPEQAAQKLLGADGAAP
jgi:hypothetical protein